LSNATTSTSPTNNSNKPSNTSKGGGGSKDGRIKCPKCGQHVLFQHADFEENTFYCATCSSWFLVAPSSDSSKLTNTAPLEHQQQQRSSNSSGSSVGNVSLTLYSPFCHSTTGLLFSYNEMSHHFHLSLFLSFTTFIQNTNKVKDNFPMERERQFNTSKSYVDKKNSTTNTTTAATYNSLKSHDPDKYVQYSSINSETIASKQDHPSPKIRPITRTIPTPIEICNGLDEYVIGQKNVKIALAVSVYNHYKRITIAERNSYYKQLQQQEQQKSNNHETTEIPSRKPYCEVSRNMVQQPNSSIVEDAQICEVDKSNLIIIGPTGSGKVFFVEE
jgi:flagellar biosynthesis GTPase FlhF/ribosomal protein S27AE